MYARILYIIFVFPVHHTTGAYIFKFEKCAHTIYLHLFDFILISQNVENTDERICINSDQHETNNNNNRRHHHHHFYRNE